MNYKTELFGCYTFIMKYPDTDFKFKPKLLTVVLKNFPVFHKYRTGEYKEGTMGHKINEIYKYFDVDRMLQQIQRILFDMEQAKKLK